MRLRYEWFCDARLVKVTEQAEAPGVDSPHFWMVDNHTVDEDVAQAMLAEWGQETLA